MPLYDYKCKKCGIIELSMSVDKRNKAKCPKCRTKIERVMSTPAISFKGSGFYCTDSNPKPLEQKSTPAVKTETKSAGSVNKGKIKRNT